MLLAKASLMFKLELGMEFVISIEFCRFFSYLGDGDGRCSFRAMIVIFVIFITLSYGHRFASLEIRDGFIGSCVHH